MTTDTIRSIADATANGNVIDTVLGGTIPGDPVLARHYESFVAVSANRVEPLNRDRATGRALHLLRKGRLLGTPYDRPFAADFGEEVILVVPEVRAFTLARYERLPGGRWGHDRCVVRFKGAEATVLCNPAHGGVDGHMAQSQEIASATVATLLHWLLSMVEGVTTRAFVEVDGQRVELSDDAGLPSHLRAPDDVIRDMSAATGLSVAELRRMGL